MEERQNTLSLKMPTEQMVGASAVSRLRWAARFPGQSLHRAFRLLGIRGLQERKATRNISKAAEKAPSWLWIESGHPWCSALLGHKPGTDQPDWIAQTTLSDDLRIETPVTLGSSLQFVQAAPVSYSLQPLYYVWCRCSSWL